ncbi:site-specific integrase [Synechococcus sp. AH-707-M23]|nr:site-specific integrase [Synechococcus sp. AH-707-M23]
MGDISDYNWDYSAPTVAKQLPYLTKRSDADGWFFLRRVPLDIKEKVGKTQWRWKLAETLAEARRLLPQAVADTDQVIAQVRAGKTPRLPSPNQQPRSLSKTLLAGQPTSKVFQSDYFIGTPEEAQAISELPPVQLSGTRQVTDGDLLDLKERLQKDRSDQTADNWRRFLGEFVQFLGHNQMNQVTKEDAQKFRDNLLDRVKVSTTKTRIGCVSGLFELAVEEELLSINPFKGTTKRLVSPKSEQLEKLFNPQSDVRILKMPQHHQELYWLLRFSGMRLGEAAGLQLDDIDLDQMVIRLIDHPDRPLKTSSSKRLVPIHTKLVDHLKKLKDRGLRPFLKHYAPDRSRWEVGTNWKLRIGSNAHSLRHHAATCMRDASFDTFVIGTVLGHSTGSTMTSQYGSVDFDRVRAAIESIS